MKEKNFEKKTENNEADEFNVEKEKTLEVAKKLANGVLTTLEELCRIFPSPPGSSSREFHKQVKENLLNKIKEEDKE